MESQAFQGMLAINPPAQYLEPQHRDQDSPRPIKNRGVVGKAAQNPKSRTAHGAEAGKKFPAMVFRAKKPADIASTLGIWPIATVHEGTGSKPI